MRTPTFSSHDMARLMAEWRVSGNSDAEPHVKLQALLVQGGTQYHQSALADQSKEPFGVEAQ